jgi:hypothetical protein
VFWLTTPTARHALLATSTYYPHWDLGVPMRLGVTNVAGVGRVPPYWRFAGFAYDITMLMVPGAGGVNISAVKVTLGGVWRRIGQGSVVKSPLLRTILGRNSAAPIAYWPMEDGEAAAQFASGLPGGTPMTLGAVNIIGGAPAGATNSITFAANDLLDGSKPLPSFGGTTYLRSDMPVYADTGAWASQMMFYLPPTSASGGAISEYWTDSATLPVVVIDVGISGDPRWVRARVFASDLTTVAASLQINFPARDMVPGRWMSLAVKSVSANDLSMAVLDTSGSILMSGSVAVGAGFHSALRKVFQRNMDAAVAGTCFGHSAVWIHTSWTATVEGALYARAAGAYRGEQVHVRIPRVCAEEGIVCSCTATQSNEAGAQPIADVIEVLTDGEAVDHGILFEDQSFGLGYRACSQRENLSAALTVDLSTYRTTKGTQGDVLTPVRTTSASATSGRSRGPAAAATPPST